MFREWNEQIVKNQSLVKNNFGTKLAIMVAGSFNDSEFWQAQFEKTHRLVFNNTGDTQNLIIIEEVRKGNFLGILNAWKQIKLKFPPNQIPNVFLMNMVFGRGKRLSPFTQSLGNRKSAFPTPIKTESNSFLTLSDLTSLYSNGIIEHLSSKGFKGVVVKWGDEIIIPSRNWDDNVDYKNVDVIRFYGETKLDDSIAKEKEWFATNRDTGFLDFHYPRQNIDLIKTRFAPHEITHKLGLNIGSIAISYDFLDMATRIFSEDIDNQNIWLDADPYVWIALLCNHSDDWAQHKEYEDRTGLRGIKELESRYPHFFSQVTKIKTVIQHEKQRNFKIGVLDFGVPLWIDWGLHTSLRKSLETLTLQTDIGKATRTLFGLRENFDKNGNLIINSYVSPKASIFNSVIIDTSILSSHSVIQNGVVLGCNLRRLYMPYGGSSLFCACDHLEFAGPNNIAFKSIGKRIVLGSSERHTSICFSAGIEDYRAEESSDFVGREYDTPILGNRLSFQELDSKISRVSYLELTQRWNQLWNNWLI